LRNESVFSAPQLKRDPLGSRNQPFSLNTLLLLDETVVIFGPAAVGKMAVGLELQRLTGLRPRKRNACVT